MEPEGEDQRGPERGQQGHAATPNGRKCLKKMTSGLVYCLLTCHSAFMAVYDVLARFTHTRELEFVV